MTKDGVLFGLLVSYLAATFGLLVVFHESELRMPGWLSGALVVVGVALIGWALWSNRSVRGSR